MQILHIYGNDYLRLSHFTNVLNIELSDIFIEKYRLFLVKFSLYEVLGIGHKDVYFINFNNLDEFISILKEDGIEVNLSLINIKKYNTFMINFIRI